MKFKSIQIIGLYCLMLLSLSCSKEKSYVQLREEFDSLRANKYNAEATIVGYQMLEKYREQKSPDIDTLCRILGRTGWLEASNNHLESAEKLFREEVQLREKEPRNEAYIKSLMNLAGSLSMQGKYADAVQLSKIVIEYSKNFAENSIIEDSTYLSERVLENAIILNKAGEYDESVRELNYLLANALSRNGKLTTDRRLQINATMTTNYLNLNEYSKAKKYALENCSIIEEQYGKTTTLYADALQSLGMVYTKLKQYELSKKCLSESLDIDNKLNSDEKTVTPTYVAFGELFFETGNYKEADKYFLESLQRLKKESSFNKQVFPFIAEVVWSLGFSYTYQNRFEEAEREFDDARKIIVQFLGEKSKKLIQVYRGYEQIAKAKGDVQKAEEYRQKWLKLEGSAEKK